MADLSITVAVTTGTQYVTGSTSEVFLHLMVLNQQVLLFHGLKTEQFD